MLFRSPQNPKTPLDVTISINIISPDKMICESLVKKGYYHFPDSFSTIGSNTLKMNDFTLRATDENTAVGRKVYKQEGNVTKVAIGFKILGEIRFNYVGLVKEGTQIKYDERSSRIPGTYWKYLPVGKDLFNGQEVD